MPAPSITPLPPAPIRSKYSDQFAQQAEDFVKALPQFGDELNSAVDFVEIRASNAEASQLAAADAESAALGYRDESLAAKDAALAAVNFAGKWTGLTGGLNKPATVYHQGSYWNLLNDLADVSGSEPSTSNPDWILIYRALDRDALLKKATMVCDFANSKFEAYEGPVNNIVAKAFGDLFTFTRGGSSQAVTALGRFEQVGADQPRFVGNRDGLQIELQRTNIAAPSAANQFFEFSSLGYAAGIDKNEEVPIGGELFSGTHLIGRHVISSATKYAQKTNLQLSAGKRYCFSLYVKINSSSANSAGIRISGTYGDPPGDIFIDKNGVIGTFGGDGGAIFEGSWVDYFGDGWWRLSFTYSPSNNAQGTIYAAIYNGTDAIFGAIQIEEGDFPTSYSPSLPTFVSRSGPATYYDANGDMQTAVADVARDNAYAYFGGILYPIGLLLEKQATNLVLWSEDLTQTNWIKNLVSITADSTAAPDGNQTADTVTASDISNVYVEQNVSYTSGNNYVFAARVKNVDADFIAINPPGVIFGAGSYVIFNLANGSVDSVGGTAPINYGIEPAGNGFYLIYAAFTAAASGSYGARFNLCVSGDVLTAVNGSSVVFWGAQVEQGDYPTSYIFTTSAQVTRPGDVSSSPQTTRVQELCERELGQEFNSASFSMVVEIDDLKIQPDYDVNPIVSSSAIGTSSSDDNWGLSSFGSAFGVGPGVIGFYGAGVGWANPLLPNVPATSRKIAVSVDVRSGVVMIAGDGVSGANSGEVFALNRHRSRIQLSARFLNALKYRNLTFFPVALTQAELEFLTS